MFVLLFSFTLFFVPVPLHAQQGCCSYHGGIDYCDYSSGKYMCKDEELSPTCYCNSEDESSSVEKKSRPSGLPVQIIKRRSIDFGGIYQRKALTQKSDEKTAEVGTKIIPYEKISKMISETKENLCDQNPDVTYEVWLSFGGSAGIAVSVTAETGMKAIIKCSNK